jgi:hypothetical protein
MTAEERSDADDIEPASLEARFEWISRELNRRFDRCEARFEANFNEIGSRFGQLHQRLDRLEQQSRIMREMVHRIEAILIARRETQ